MESLFQYVSPPSQCGYLPDQLWSLQYEVVAEISSDEYLERMLSGWRRFGNMLFRPRCRVCRACLSLRILVEHFRPSRSQKRARKKNESDVKLVIGKPSVTRAKLILYDRYHQFQATNKNWPLHPAKDPESYLQSFVENPIPTEEWQYFVDNRLVGVGYVDVLTNGLSAIYFFYDPDQRERGLGIWNVLRLIEECQKRRFPHLYLGYYVKDCPSLNYKAGFVPNQTLQWGGDWVDYLT